jgi:hypothetical protein
MAPHCLHLLFCRVSTRRNGVAGAVVPADLISLQQVRRERQCSQAVGLDNNIAEKEEYSPVVRVVPNTAMGWPK